MPLWVFTIYLPALRQSGQTKLVVWTFAGQSIVPPLCSFLYLGTNFQKIHIGIPTKITNEYVHDFAF